MNKDTLNKVVKNCKGETKEAIETIIAELNNGQQKKLLKNKKIKALFERYGVEV
jgi:hypothetical protein